jgi:prepilin-type N-terminal cleavage/methylation domain-containing protein
MHKQENAFTLAELLIVIVTIGILAAIAMIKYGGVQESARSAEAYSVLAEIVSAENRYFIDGNNTYTTTITSLDCFDTAPVSDNFTFSIPSANASSGYAQAARTSATGGRQSYGMCLKGGKRAGCAAATCNPVCP